MALIVTLMAPFISLMALIVTLMAPFISLMALIVTLMALPAMAETVEAGDWRWAPDLLPGAPLPHFELPDVDGNLRSSESLVQPGGLVLFFNRSTVW